MCKGQDQEQEAQGKGREQAQGKGQAQGKVEDQGDCREVYGRGYRPDHIPIERDLPVFFHPANPHAREDLLHLALGILLRTIPRH